jgi:hypothetical protein
MSLTYMSELMVFKKYGSCYLCNSNPHTNLLIVKGHIESLSWINTVAIPTVLGIDILCKMEPNFIN